MKQLFNRDWTQVLQSMNPQEAFDTLEKVYNSQLSYAYHQKSLLMLVASNHCGYDTSTPRVESITKTIFEHAMNTAMSPEEPERTLKGN